MTNGEKPVIRLTSATHPFLEGFDTEFLAAASEGAEALELPPEAMIFHSGERARHLYLMLEGKVALEIEAPDHPRITIQTIGPREVLGWSWLVPPYTWPVDARVLKPTRVIALDAGVLERYLEAHPDVGYRFLRRLIPVIAKRLDEARIQLVDIHGT